MAEAPLTQLKEWLVVNSQAGVGASMESAPAQGNSDSGGRPVQSKPSSASGYTSLVTEWAEIEKEVELYGPDLEPALHLIAQRALTLTWASGTAIALINKLNPVEMICRARAGTDSPEMGARVEAGSGFSGECVRTATTLKCDDSEYDSRVDRKSCRGLGIRSIVACPVKRKDEVIGILEVFSPEPAAFWENDITVLERLTSVIERAVRRAEHTRADVLAFPLSGDSLPNSTAVFPSFENVGVIQQPPSLRRKVVLALIGLGALTATIWLVAPWTANSKNSSPVEQSVEANSARASYVGVDLKDLKSHAATGDAAAQYQLGMRYASGEGVKQDNHEALRWFGQAAERGHVRAQSKVAACYWSGKGAPRDYSKAYFWALLAEAGGDKDASLYRTDSGNHLSQAQSSAEHIAAENWLHAHHIGQASDSAQ
jgi:putative methionine-R-sulfoxide reductase with GAF domain